MDFKIGEHYRTRADRKVECVAIRNNKAIVFDAEYVGKMYATYLVDIYTGKLFDCFGEVEDRKTMQDILCPWENLKVITNL